MSREKIEQAMDDVQAYRGTDMYLQFVNLLGHISDAYDEDLRTVTAEKLGYKQGASAQVRILRDCLINRTQGDIPKV